MGLLDGVTSFLTSPGAELLVPTVASALGGYLTSPRLAGGRKALGQALLGGAQGLQRGQQTAVEQQRLNQEQALQQAQLKDLAEHTTYMSQQSAMLTQAAKNEEDWRNRIQAIADTMPEQYKPFVMAQLDVPPDQRGNAVKSIGQVIAAPHNIKMLQTMIPGLPADVVSGLQPDELSGLVADTWKNRVAAKQAPLAQIHDAYVNAGYSDVDAWNQAARAMKPNNSVALDMPVPIADPSSPTGYTYRTKADAIGKAAPAPASAAPKPGTLEPGADGFYHLIDRVTGADSKTDVRVPARSATTAIETGADGYYHLIDRSTGADTKTDLKTPSTKAKSSIRMVAGADGYFHRVNLDTGNDLKLDIKVPARGGHLELGADGKYYIIRPDGTSQSTDLSAPPNNTAADRQGESESFRQYQDQWAARQKEIERWDNNAVGMDPADATAVFGRRPRQLPDYKTWKASQNAGAASSGASPASAGKEDAGLPAGAVGKTSRPDGKYTMNGKNYRVEKGYVFPD